MGALPKITICMSCYNAANSIETAIQSAASQSWDNKDLLIVDDCSQDNSVEVVLKAIENIPYARLLKHEKNQGVAGSVNTLVGNATGEFLVFFDDDDTSLPHRLETQYQTLIAYEQNVGTRLIACYAGTQKTYSNGYIANTPPIGSQPRIPVGEDMVRFQLYLPRDPAVFYGSGTPNCALMTRVETMRAVGPYDGNLRRNEDADFSVRLGLLGGHFIGTTEILVHQTSTVGADKNPEVVYNSDLFFLTKYADILKKYGRYDFALSWSKIKYHHYSGRDFQAFLVFLKSFTQTPLAHLAHFWRAVPRRYLHERRMKKGLHA